MAENITDAVAIEAKPTCFVIMPFTDPDGYEKGHFRKIYDQIFVPAIEKAGYTPHRVDEEIESTMIHGKLLNQLVTAPMVLCDISSRNPNVLYELGIRHAFDKPVVLVQEVGQSRIFDISGLSTTDYRRARRYDEVLEDRENISRAIKQTAEAKNYSIMSLVRLTPAVMKSENDLTSEDRIALSMEEFEKKLNRIESMVERNYRRDRPAMKRMEMEAADARLVDTKHRAKMILSNQDDGNILDAEIRDAIFFLRESIIDCQRLNFPAEITEDAKKYLVDLQNILNARQE